MRKTTLIFVLMALFVAGFVSAQCTNPACDPYSSASVRGTPFTSTNKASLCLYSGEDNCNPGLGVQDRWSFNDGDCADISCVRSCTNCNATGGQCDSRKLGDFNHDCIIKDGCDCTAMEGFPSGTGPSETEVIPEYNTTSFIILLGMAVVVIGVFLLKKK